MTVFERRGRGDEAEALGAEAAVLRSLELCGLPVVGSLEDDDGEVVLRTEVPPGVPLRERVPLPARTAAGIVLAVAATARELGEAGVDRGAIRLDQIHLAAGTRPVLRHLAGAARVGDAPRREPGAADLGRLLLALLPPPGRRRWRLRDDGATELRRVGHRASDPTVTLDRFSAMVREAAPDAALPPLAAAASTAREDRGRGAIAHFVPPARWRGLGGATIALLAMTMAATVFLRPEPARTDATAAVTSPASRLPVGSPEKADDADDAVAVWPRYGCTRHPGPTIRVAGEECPQPASVHGTTVSVGPRSWSIGGAGSYALALGDWDCSGRSSVAALDVETGELWLFGSPAAEPETSVASFVGRAPGAVALAASAGGCGPIHPTDAVGAAVPVSSAPEAGR